MVNFHCCYITALVPETASLLSNKGRIFGVITKIRRGFDMNNAGDGCAPHCKRVVKNTCQEKGSFKRCLGRFYWGKPVIFPAQYRSGCIRKQLFLINRINYLMGASLKMRILLDLPNVLRDLQSTNIHNDNGVVYSHQQ